MTVSLQGVPAEILSIIQDRTLERVFHDALFPRLLFRSEAMPELWPVNLGERVVFTRPGLIPVNKKPLTAGQDPAPSTYAFEQWEAEAAQFGDTIDTHMPTSYVSMAPLFLRNTVQLGLNAGETLNQLVRDRLFRAYLGGNTALTAETVASAQISVASLNGFTETIANGRPVPVSPTSPIAAVVGTEAVSVIGATPTDPENPFGPGVLTLAANITAAIPVRTAVLASNRSRIVRVGGGTTVDAIDAANILTLQDVINAVARLRAARVPTMSDGFYHVHLTPEGESQIYQSEQWQRLYTALPESAAYRDLAIGQLVGCRFYRNTECPNTLNTSDQVVTGTNAATAGDIGGEVINENAVEVRRAVVLGGGSIYEKYLDESKYMTEAGTTGKIGSFTVVNNGVQVMTNRIRFILRAPLDRLQQVVAQSWSWSGDFPVPSDALTFDTARFKRAVVIEHA